MLGQMVLLNKRSTSREGRWNIVKVGMDDGYVLCEGLWVEDGLIRAT